VCRVVTPGSHRFSVNWIADFTIPDRYFPTRPKHIARHEVIGCIDSSNCRRTVGRFYINSILGKCFLSGICEVRTATPLCVGVTESVAPILKADKDNPPLPDSVNGRKIKKETVTLGNQHDQRLPKVRISGRTTQPKRTSVAAQGLSTYCQTSPNLNSQIKNTIVATKVSTLSQLDSDKLILLAQALAVACQKNTSPDVQGSNGNTPTVLAMQSLRNFIADPVRIPAGAVGLEQVKSLLVLTMSPKQLSQTTPKERSRRVLLPLQLLIATLPRGPLQQGMALAKLDLLASTLSRGSS
jgi:hypothetical protein